jgi:hypothetical protein
VFEGGHSLYTPLPGTTGFTRLFAREHALYTPRSEAVRAMAEDARENDNQTAQAVTTE